MKLRIKLTLLVFIFLLSCIAFLLFYLGGINHTVAKYSKKINFSDTSQNVLNQKQILKDETPLLPFKTTTIQTITPLATVLATNTISISSTPTLIETLTKEKVANDWWKVPDKKEKFPDEKVELKTKESDIKKDWWEMSPGTENLLLVNATDENQNWWEPPKKIEQKEVKKEESLPWWLNQDNVEDYDKFLQLTDDTITNYDTTLFDLYLADQQLGLILVNYTDKWFVVPEPKDLIEQLSGVKSPSKILPLIQGKIPNYRKIAGVGEIALDTNTFQLILTVDKENLTQTQLALNRMIGNPINKFSLENRVSFTTSGDLDKNDSNNSFAHKTLASYGKQFLLAQGYVDDENKYELQELNLGTIVDKYSVKGGYISNKGSNFSPSMEILGVKIETEEQLFVDNDLTRGSKIEIFVPSTAKVLFYRNNVLIDYQILNYGLQEINTTRFPQGSYDVDIEIREYNGRITKERRFFTKSGFLATRDRPIYYASLGSGRDQTDLIQVPVIEAGRRWRANDYMESEVSIFGTESIGIASSAIRGLWQDYYFDIVASVSDDLDPAYNVSLNTTFKDTFFSISWTEVPGDDDFYYQDNFSDKDSYIYSASSIKNKRRTISANIQRNYKNISYGLQGSWNTNTRKGSENIEDSYDDDSFLVTTDNYAFGPWVRVKLLQDSRQSLDLSANYYIKKTDDNFHTNLAYNKRLDKKIANNTSLSFDRENDSYTKLANELTYDNLNTSTNQGVRVGLNTEGSKYNNDSDASISNNLQLSYGNPFLLNNSNLYNRLQNSDSTTNYASSIQASMILTEDGFGKIMTPQRNNSMVIISINDKSKNKHKKANNEFSIFINGNNYTKAIAGTPVAIALNPYKTYNIRIEATEESDLTQYDNKAKSVTLFPGNIAPLSWDINSIYIGIGRILDNENNPIKHQKIKGVSGYVYTEDDGSFQADLTGEEKLYIDSEKYNCKISLPKSQPTDIIVDYGDIICK